MEGLFLLEVLVNHVRFSPNVNPLPRKKDIKIFARFSKIADFNLRYNRIIKLSNPKEEDERFFTIGCGESVLFFGKCQDLLYKLRTCPLSIKIYMKEYILGSVMIPWKDNFIKIVALHGTSDEETVTPATMIDSYDFFLNNGEDFMGSINLDVRLFCIHKSIERDLRKITGGENKGVPYSKFLFKGRDEKPTFIVQKCGIDVFSDTVPVVPLYSPGDADEGDEKAWQSLYESEMNDTASIAPMFNENHDGNVVKLISDEEGKELVNTEKRFDLQKDEKEPCTRTTESLEKLLCKNPDCPAVRKFKEYGIGPLAMTNGIGCLTGKVDVPLKYGISQTYGVFKCYGPYGILTKVDSEDQLYENNEENETSSGGCKLTDDLLKLKGGNLLNCCLTEFYLNDSESTPLYPKPLRLKGGAPISDTIAKVAEPIAACKILMQQMDDVVTAFKEALGPCGKATCRFNANIAKENCKQVCAPPKEESVCSPEATSACGSPTCPYTKLRQENELDYDALMELQLMDSEMVKSCGSPQCPFPLAPPLEPIHWECPDPLPKKGQCKNKNCPYKPKEPPRSPREGLCGSKDCPYAPPRSCGNPKCPFQKRKPCPYGDDESSTCSNPSCVLNKQKKPAACSNPLCPNASSRKPNIAGNTGCPGEPSDECFVQTCDNPECKFKNTNGSPSCSEGVSTAGVRTNCSNCPSSIPKMNTPTGCPCSSKTINNNNNCPPSMQSTNNDNKKKSQSEINKCGSFNESLQQEQDEGSFVCDDPCCPYILPICCVCGKIFVPCPPPCPPPPSCSPCKGDCGTCEESCTPCPPPCPPPPCPPGYPVCPECMGYKPQTDNVDICDSATCAVADGSTKCIECKGSTPAGAGDNVPSSNKASRKSRDDLGKSGQGDETIRSDKNRISENNNKKKNTANSTEKKTKKLKKKSDEVTDRYPGVRIGHQFCCMPGFRVPRRQGWLWNTHVPCLGLKPRRGWRPGAITATVANRIMKHRRARLKSRQSSHKSSRKRRRNEDSDSDVTVAPRPTLEIHRKEGAYWITMNPIKDPNTIDEKDPYMDCMPMEFRITKNKEKVMIKGADDDDYKTCYCGEDDDENVYSDSELDIEFSPPGLLRHRALKRRNKPKAEADTQYNPADFAVAKSGKGGKGKGKGKGKKGKGGKKGKKK